MVLMEFTITFPKENATFSTITGMDRAIIGLVTSGFKEMAAREKPKALSFWFRFLQAAARRKVWEIMVATEIILIPQLRT